MLSHRKQLPQTASSMSPAHSYTLIQPDDDDDSDICPVCDGECTCHSAVQPISYTSTAPPPLVPGVPLSMAELSLRYAAASSAPNSPSSGQSYPPSTPSSTPAPAPKQQPKPSLKIKLTVPQSMLAKRKLHPPSSSSTPTTATIPLRAYKSAAETTSDFAAAGYHSPEPSSSYTTTKKRGRPPKASASARQHPSAKSLSPTAHISKLLHNKAGPLGKHPKTSSSAAKVRQSLKARAAVVKKTANKRRRVVSSDDDGSSLSDVDMAPPRRAPYADDDAESGTFPTFVSASALSSMSSDTSDSSSSLSDFDSDSSIEAEEENFILADVQDKARLKRELLGGDDPSIHKKRTGHNNDWVIRPRKKSVGPSDVEMDVDSDATEDDDEEEGDGEDEEDADETEEDATMSIVGPLTLGLGDDYEEGESTDDHHRYTGHATGWSDDDDESSFDADIFFANLSDSDTSSDSDRSPAPALRWPKPKTRSPFAVVSNSMGEDGDQSDISGISESTEGARGRGHVRRATLESLPFEVTESWDGQLVFTNGVHDSQGLVDLEFEEDAREFGVDSSCAAASASGTDAAGESHDDSRLGDSDADMSDGGYEEESGGDGSGDTTDEELVGPDALPNARAMSLFSLPMSVSAIDPLSTVSSPAVSPGRTRVLGQGKGKGYGYKWPGWDARGRGRWSSSAEKEMERERRKRMWGGEGVRAADILEGRLLFWDSDEQEHDRDDMELRRRRFAAESGAEEDEDEEDYDDDCEEDERGSGSGSGEGKSTRMMRRERRRRKRRDRTPCGPRQGVFVPSSETRQAVIGDDKKGAAVPSPHPRFSKRGKKSAGRFSTVETLLRRHLFESVGASNASSLSNSLNVTNNQLNSLGSPLNLNGLSSTLNGLADASTDGPTAQSSAETAADMCASLDLLFSSAAQVLSGNEERLGMGFSTIEAETIQLDDVLDASFLADEGSSSSSAGVGASLSADGHSQQAEDGASGTKSSNLTRWDLISVGAFRQTREASWEGRHTPAASADFGNVMKPAPMSAMMWQNQAGVVQQQRAEHGHHHQHHHYRTQTPTPTGLGHGLKGGVVKGSKHAKRRQVMMGGGSLMCSPLILPSSGPVSSASAPASLAGSPASFAKHAPHHQQDQQQQQQKSRRELRRERKMMKKGLKAHGSLPAHHTHVHGYVHGHPHQFHAHSHHPNAKLRGSGAVQRTNFFGGAVPPLNL
ncbi:hypothetical protein BDN70DRAFT_998522 [Pholiota conissans]|uniref:Uncharacterized protein n=1 Tax=Pholiota conissans TaxID=109636 RepID=A0A9P5YLX6_9AGAR|nr:hypothetical protein BDN70DRAFT_998522 [Pholiota conissans]